MKFKLFYRYYNDFQMLLSRVAEGPRDAEYNCQKHQL